MSLTENRTWTITCKRFLVEQCLDQVTVEADDDVRSTVAAEKVLRGHGWTIHEDGLGTCPVCEEVWEGNTKFTPGNIRAENGEAVAHENLEAL